MTGVLVSAAVVGLSACGGGSHDAHSRKAPTHKISAITIDSEKQVIKEQDVHVKSKGRVDWYLLNAAPDYAAKTVRLVFVESDQPGAPQVPYPTDHGDCNKCTAKIDNNGVAQLWLMAKEAPFSGYYKICIVNAAADPCTTPLADPKFEIDP
ncbi:MAG TPA: hypothetical protein VFX12_04650 [Vicinamibacterales bacterium]|nr:hypothetical protein [Vicinamibacterales bacterium]